MNEKTLNLYPIDYPFETLLSRIDSDDPKLILDPDFQRAYKWDKEGWERASKFIESCLMRIPLPSCYFAENDNGKHIVIDGVQRLTTIVKFMKNEFKLEGMSVFKNLNGKYFSELEDFRTDIETTTIRCIVLRKDNPKGLIQEIFSRLNQGAVQLSHQEIRHAIYPGSFDNLLSELSRNDFIKNFKKNAATDNQYNSREPEELVLRFFALQDDLGDYDDNLKKLLDDTMIKNQNLPEKYIKKHRELFLGTLKKCLDVFGDDTFIDTNKKRRKQSTVYYDLIMYCFSKYEYQTLIDNKVNINAAFKFLCNLPHFQKTLSGGLQNKSSIEIRRAMFIKSLSEVFGG